MSHARNTVCPVCLQPFALGQDRTALSAAGRALCWVHAGQCAERFGAGSERVAQLALSASRGYLKKRWPRVSLLVEAVASVGRYRREARHGRT